METLGTCAFCGESVLIDNVDGRWMTYDKGNKECPDRPHEGHLGVASTTTGPDPLGEPQKDQ